VTNIFDTKQRVRDSNGVVPFNFQPDLLDAQGRTVAITIRKLFLPPPSSFRRSERSGGGDE
jgi:outer membrane receptor protein involved in Fe transport